MPESFFDSFRQPFDSHEAGVRHSASFFGKSYKVSPVSLFVEPPADDIEDKETCHLKGGVDMADISGVSVRTAASGTGIQSPVKKEASDTRGSLDLYEMMRDAREQAEAVREKFQSLKKGSARYGDAPIEAYARLARARRPAEVNAAAGYARRQIARLKAAKRTDPDNAKRIQAAINQLQKAVNRAGKKKQELNREKTAEARQKKLAQEKRTREAQRQRQELRRKQAARMLRESGYIREAEIDNRMQAHISSVQMELRKQAQDLAASLQPPVEAAAQQYAAAAEVPPPAESGGGIDVQA